MLPNTQVTFATPLVVHIENRSAVSCKVMLAVNELLHLSRWRRTPQETKAVLGVYLKPYGGRWELIAKEAFVGMTRSRFVREREFLLSGPGPWLVKVARVTPDSATHRLRNATYVESITTS